MHAAWGEPVYEDVSEWFNDTPYYLEQQQGVGSPTLRALPYSRADENIISQELLSDNKKLVLIVNPTYFHMLMDTFAVATHEVLKSKNLELVFVLMNIETPLNLGNTRGAYNYFIEKLKQVLKVKVHEIDLSNPQKTIINNFYMYKEVSGNVSTSLQLAELLGPTDQEKYSLSPKKIYLSRRKTISNVPVPDELTINWQDEDVRNKYQYKTNDRIDNEKLVEEYFESLGFEIVSPEEFVDYKDQIKIISQAKCVASVTSASLTSALFMRPCSTVIELITPLITPLTPDSDIKSVHSHYQAIAASKDLFYVGIPHERNAENLIKKIKENTILENYLKSI